VLGRSLADVIPDWSVTRFAFVEFVKASWPVLVEGEPILTTPAAVTWNASMAATPPIGVTQKLMFVPCAMAVKFSAAANWIRAFDWVVNAPPLCKPKTP
jgi:hypothetical protein